MPYADPDAKRANQRLADARRRDRARNAARNMTSGQTDAAWNPQTPGSARKGVGPAGLGEASTGPADPRCSYAGCGKLGPRVDDNYPQWRFCVQHYLEHRADMYDESWPHLTGHFPRPLAPCGTTAAARRHQRNGEKCQVCADAARRASAPHNPNGYRGSWYRPGAA